MTLSFHQSRTNTFLRPAPYETKDGSPSSFIPLHLFYSLRAFLHHGNTHYVLFRVMSFLASPFFSKGLFFFLNVFLMPCMLMPRSDVVYCPKDQEDMMRDLLKSYGGHRHKTVLADDGKRQGTFVYIPLDD
jgi:hypothetical protein